MATETRDPKQAQDTDFAKLYAQWTGDAKYSSPLVDHLPVMKGIPTPKDVIGYYVGAPKKLTYYADMLKYYRALAAATPRVKVEVIGKSDEGRDLVVVWVSSDDNIKKVSRNRANLAKLADPRGLTDVQIQQLIATTKPHYDLMGGLHSSETGPSEMLMELHVGARAELEAVADDCIRLIRVLDDLNQVRFRDDPELLAAWESASDVVWPVKARKNVAPAPAQAPVTPPVAETPPAVADPRNVPGSAPPSAEGREAA